MKGVQTTFAIANTLAFRKFEFVVTHTNSGAVKTNTPQCFHHWVEKSLMIDGFRQLQMPKIPRITLVVQTAQPRIVRTTVHGLAVHLRFVTCHTRRNGTVVDVDGLGDGVLTEFVGVDNAELEFGDATETDIGVTEIFRRHAETGGAAGVVAFGRHYYCCCCFCYICIFVIFFFGCCFVFFLLGVALFGLLFFSYSNVVVF
mmetsp:Transcript_954/g.1382  ORF Transcript_954/g.1382 Transcript_954/m.1382 type:complete len:201 (-) Transcript_954:265-867(-)